MDVNIVTINNELKDLIPNFLKNRSIEINSLKEATITLNFETIKFLSHTLKGTAGGYGFDYMSLLAKKIELATIDRSLEKIENLTLELEQHFNNMKIIYVEE
ncbi:Hpt domain-containing protein [Clostridium gasigenes]|uniref:Hpt domain-containing protein n=1 Tax=Clostridium gasigenes TaxID=94869 RepID=UPI001C0DCBBC|nr:Hpt domain-containing protein [Clostridium gasigenes]MBU3107953.1 Hpt domain-containing protein [Clostridium gasigenes]